jgi:membrane fusion protein (multidrug efflux system)
VEEGSLHHNGKDQSKVRLILEDGNTYPLEGTLQFRDVSVDSTTGSVTLRVIVPNPKGLLLPGMYLRAVVQEGINNEAILIPQQAVSRDPMGNPVTLIVDGNGKVAQRMLTLDRAIGDRWLVTSGLAPGERVIVEGVQKVRPGASVKVVPFQADGTSGSAPQKAKSN